MSHTDRTARSRSSPQVGAQQRHNRLALEAGYHPRGRERPTAITHGNLGPETILWTSTLQVQVVALTGMVHEVPDSLTGIGVVDQGAPYRIEAEGPSTRADRYAVATLAFELVTRQLWRDVRATRLAEDALATLRPELADWLRRGLMTGEGEGFGSAGEMASAWAQTVSASSCDC